MQFDPKPGTWRLSTFSASAGKELESECQFAFPPEGITRTAEKQIRSTRLPLAAADCGNPACSFRIFSADHHGYRPKRSRCSCYSSHYHDNTRVRPHGD